jgi:hypothetical protein
MSQKNIPVVGSVAQWESAHPAHARIQGSTLSTAKKPRPNPDRQAETKVLGVL